MLALGMALNTVRQATYSISSSNGGGHISTEPTFPKSDFTLTCFPETPKYAV
jgi:hypothetical protein